MSQEFMPCEVGQENQTQDPIFSETRNDLPEVSKYCELHPILSEQREVQGTKADSPELS